MSRVRRVGTAGLLLVAALVAAAAGYVIEHQDPVPRAGQIPGYADPPAGSAAATSPARTAVHVVFLGDDYTAGVGASSASARWTALVGRTLHLDAVDVAEPGAGYLAHGRSGKNYQDLVASVAADRPDVVVVSGGRNDAGTPRQRVRTAAQAVFTGLRHRLPDAVIVAVAPWWGDSQHPAKLAPVDAAVKAAAQAVGGQYLDVADPLVGHPGWMADAADPDDAGYQAIAASVAPALRDRLPRAAPSGSG